MTYQEAIDWLYVQLPMYQKQGQKAYKADLSNIQLLAHHLNNPERKFKSIHVAGTNGKGSTSHIIASILQEAGYKVGLYTSPHLKDFRERIRINGEMIAKEKVVDFLKMNMPFFKKEHLSFFEMTVGLAFECFTMEKVDIAVVEVGLGGRLDSTNILKPEISVITNIGLDHTHILGDTHEKIAFEKGGIIKTETPCVIGDSNSNTLPVFKKIAKEKNATLILAQKHHQEHWEIDLLGHYQQENAQTAVTTIKALKNKGWKIIDKHIYKGLKNVVKNTNLKGRWQQLGSNPKIICDTAHNKEGLSITMNQLKQEKADTIHLVIGIVKDKDIQSIINLFPKEAYYYFCQPNNARALQSNILAEAFKYICTAPKIFDSVKAAYSAAKQNASANDIIYVGGSTFVVAEVL